MDASKIVEKNNDAWNRHDLDAVVAAYAEGATYSHPRVSEDLTGKAIRNFVKAVWVAYPDAKVEIISTGDTGDGLVATQWVMHATNTGTLPDGTAATDRKVALRGASFAKFEGDKIRSERVYFDMHNLFQQLGLEPKLEQKQKIDSLREEGLGERLREIEGQQIREMDSLREELRERLREIEGQQIREMDSLGEDLKTLVQHSSEARNKIIAYSNKGGHADVQADKLNRCRNFVDKYDLRID